MEPNRPGQPEQKLLRVSHAARILGLSRQTLYRMVHKGEIAHRLVGGRYIRIPVDAVLRELGEPDGKL